MALRSTQSVKSLLLTHELALVLLVLVTGALGGAWGIFWQVTSVDSARLETMNYSVQHIRGALFRQIKEVALARLMEDSRALRLYSTYSRQIDASFNVLRERSQSREEQQRIQDLQVAYRIVQHDMNNVFADPYLLNRVTRLNILDPTYEQRLVGDFDKACESLDQLIGAERQQLEAMMRRWTRLLPAVLAVPLLAGIALVLFSRHKLQERVVKPLASVLTGARLMRSGNLHERIAVNGVEEVAVLAESLNAMSADLKHSHDALVMVEKQSALGALVPVIAHNIRNPLAAIRANAQLLEAGDNPEDLLDARNAIIETTDRLSRWVSALVAYLHPTQPQLRDELPSVVVQAVLTLLRPKLEAARIKVVQDWASGELPFAMDVDLTEQCVHGLVSNAIEASPLDAELKIVGTLEASHFCLAIVDKGHGLPFTPEASANLQPGRTTKRFGTGLGIPFAFKVCSLHGWTLKFLSSAGGGTRAEIHMPLTQASGARDASA